MFIPSNRLKYSTMASLISEARRTGEFPGRNKTPQIGDDSILGSQLLYAQSNGQILIGQDALGRMHFVCAPGKRDFPLPTLRSDGEQLVTAAPGMFYQADFAMLLGKLQFLLTMQDGAELCSGSEDAHSCYLDDVLPMTQVKARGLALTSVSIAPVLEPSARAALSPLPLPGPSGAMHALHVKNESNQTIHAEAHLSLLESFATSNNHRARRPYQAEWDENMLLIWRPDACAAIQAPGFSPVGNPGAAGFWRELTLAPGEEVTLTCIVAVSNDVSNLIPAVSTLYRHSMLEWINLTLSFWAERLGSLRPLPDDALQQRSIDFSRRCIIDNFNCLQMDESGTLIAHLQGAPSQQGGRFWGIDAEPTALSVLSVMPELAGPILRYLVDRNRPAHTPYPEHSTPILMAPLVIAGMYYEWTGDIELLRRERHVTRRLLEDARTLLELRHESGLIPSRYSSDGHVFHRYDFGTNCKAYLALTGMARVSGALGKDDVRAVLTEAAAQLREAVLAHMTQDGPFGTQFSGGSNMGEYECFYLRDDLMYYDGEDSSSCLAPLYGLLSLDDPSWQNYHRFARSLFCTNYDPEADALRWFAWGGAVDGTALVSAVGGSVTRADMASRLMNLLDFGCDETGSLFWWPKAKNWVRGLTRCSQGAGAWVYQHNAQWLGLRLDAAGRTLTIHPQGLYGGYTWTGARLGHAVFDIRVEERDTGLYVSVVNHNEEQYIIKMSARAREDTFGKACWAEVSVAAHGSMERTLPYPPADTPVFMDIPYTENQICAPDAPALGTCFFELPEAYLSEPRIRIVLLVLLSGPDVLRNATLDISVPEGFAVKQKQAALLEEYDEESFSRQIHIALGDIPSMSRRVIPLYISLPGLYRKSCGWFTRHSFAFFEQQERHRLLLRSEASQDLGSLSCALSAGSDFVERVKLEIPVCAVTAEEFEQTKLRIFGGTNQAEIACL